MADFMGSSDQNPDNTMLTFHDQGPIVDTYGLPPDSNIMPMETHGLPADTQAPLEGAVPIEPGFLSSPATTTLAQENFPAV